MDAKTTDTTGGPAFPGMTLRDWFAGQALAGMAAFPGDGHGDSFHGGGNNHAEFASYAYKLADAMIAHRATADDTTATKGASE